MTPYMQWLSTLRSGDLDDYDPIEVHDGFRAGLHREPESGTDSGWFVGYRAGSAFPAMTRAEHDDRFRPHLTRRENGRTNPET